MLLDSTITVGADNPHFVALVEQLEEAGFDKFNKITVESVTELLENIPDELLVHGQIDKVDRPGYPVTIFEYAHSQMEKALKDFHHNAARANSRPQKYADFTDPYAARYDAEERTFAILQEIEESVKNAHSRLETKPNKTITVLMQDLSTRQYRHLLYK